MTQRPSPLMISLLSLLFLLTLACVDQAVAGTLYTNGDDGYSLTLPAGWKIMDKEQGASMVACAPMTTPYPANMDVVVETLPSPLSLDTYYKTIMEHTKQKLGGKMTSVKTDDIKVGGVPAKKITFSLKQGDFPQARNSVYLFVRGLQGFNLIFNSTESDSARNAGLFKSVAESFKLHPLSAKQSAALRGFSITFPKDWEVMDQELGAYRGARPRKTSDKEEFRENVSVMTHQMDGKMTLADVQKKFRDLLSQAMTNITVSDKADLTINGRPAKVMTMSYVGNKHHFKNMIYCVANGKHCFIINCVAKPETFNQYKPIFQKIANSFAITEK